MGNRKSILSESSRSESAREATGATKALADGRLATSILELVAAANDYYGALRARHRLEAA